MTSRQLAPVWTMVALWWLRLRRDPLGLAFTLVLPVAIAVVMGAIYMSESEGPAEVGVVAGNADAASEDLHDRLRANPVLDVRAFPDRQSLDRALRRREIDAGVVIPPRMDTTVEPVQLVGAPGIASPSGVRAAVESAVAQSSAAVQLGRLLAPDDPLGAGLTAARDRLAAGTTTGPDDDRRDVRRDAAGEGMMATLVLFVFMNTMASSAAWAEWRELGVVARLRSTPARPGVVVGGFALGLAAYAAVQALIVIVVGRVLFDLPMRGPAAIAAMVAVSALAAGGAGTLLATLLPSSTSAVTIAGPLGFLLGGIGGCLWPLDIVPSTLATIGRATPHFWAVDGLQAATVEGSHLSAVGGRALALTLVAAALGALGLWRMKRAVSTV